MIFLVLALGLGAALAAYEFSPKTHALLDDYARAIQGAHAAHAAAETHLQNAGAATVVATQHAQVASVPAPEPYRPFAEQHAQIAEQATDAAIDHMAAATEANQVAAQQTAAAADAAQNDTQRAAVTQSATAVSDRQAQIIAAWARLGVGQCGVRSFSNVTAQVRDALIARLHTEGMTVTGTNPWNIETHKYDVKLRAAWNPQTRVLKLIVTAGKGGLLGLVTCDEIWKRIDPIMKEVIK